MTHLRMRRLIEVSGEYDMNKKARTIAVRISGLILGALINYGSMVLIGKVNFNGAIFLVIFAGVFSVLGAEIVGTLKILDIDRLEIYASADEKIAPEHKVESPQTIWLALFFLVMIVIFQRSA